MQDLANALATGIRGSTVAAVWALDLDEVRFPDGSPGSELIMRRSEAQAMAQPLSRILWKHRQDWAVIQWLLKLIERTESQSDLIALLIASYAYGSRIADMALFSYAMKSQQAQAARQAQAVGVNGGKPTGQTGPTRQAPGRDTKQPEPAVAGVNGIGESIYWNGGAFGATFDPIAVAPGLAEPLQPGDQLWG